MNPEQRFSRGGASDATMQRAEVLSAYGALLVLSLAIPILHLEKMADLIERMRPVMKLDDGAHAAMLMPTHLLLLRLLGQLSMLMPLCVLAALVGALRGPTFAKPKAICAIAIGQCAFTTLYAVYSNIVLNP